MTNNVLSPLTKEQKEAWIAALRSGKYVQGRHILHEKETDTYCCLGVLNSITPDIENDSIIKLYHLDIDGNMIPLLLPDHIQDTLIGMNDDGQKTFVEIADWIEENVQCQE